MIAYLDASFAFSAVLDDTNHHRAREAIRTSRHPFAVSAWTKAEFTSALMTIARRDRLERRIVEGNLARFHAWSSYMSIVQIENDDVEASASIVRSGIASLRAPDALHLAICQRVSAELLTFDKQMTEAALALGIVVAAV